MIVRWRGERLVVAVCKNLEAKLWILVQDPESARDCFTATFFDKILVGQQSLEIDPDVFAAGRSRVARKDVAASSDELIEIVGHGVLPGIRGRTSFSRNTRLCASGLLAGMRRCGAENREAAPAVCLTGTNEWHAPTCLHVR